MFAMPHNFPHSLRLAGVFLAAALLIAAGFTGCAGSSRSSSAAVRLAAALPANLPEPGREPGRQVPDGAFPGRINPSERVFVGKVLSIQWGTGNVSRMGAPGQAEVECVRAFRGVQAGRRVLVTVFKPLWHPYGEATLEMTIFSNGGADVRPGDPALELRFALTWDRQALHFHADVTDTPPGFSIPAGRRSVELFINPKRNGLVWRTPDNFQFAYSPDGTAMEWFHNRPATARIRATEHGYAVDGDIKWTELGIAPRPGLEFDLTASVTAGGIYEWDPSLELSWRYYRLPDDGFGLGTVRLE